MLIVSIQISELNTMSTRDAILVCEDSEFSTDLLKDMIIDLRMSASFCINRFRELTEK